MNPILIDFVKHSDQRYDTCGDWKDIDMQPYEARVRVSIMKDWRFMVLIAVHELCEWAICKQQHVTEQQVDAFDLSWKGRGEPGDAPYAPYHRAHQIATRIEKILSDALDVDWLAYDRAIRRLKWRET